MKLLFRKSLSVLLALALLGGLALPAAASDTLGGELTQEVTQLHQGTQLTANVFWSPTFSDYRAENYVTYDPNSAVTPIVTFGDVLRDRTTLSEAAQALENDGYRVVAGINGDFYNSANGLPVGIVITEGQLRSSDGGYHAVGFRKDGTAILGKPGIMVSLDLGYKMRDNMGRNVQIVRQAAGVNKARVSEGGIYVYTYDFNPAHTNGATEAGVDVVCSIKSGELAVGGTLKLKVERVLNGVTATPVGKNQVVLSANLKSNSYYVDALRNIPVGSTVTLTATAADTRWNNVEYAVGALYSLVEDGAVVEGLSTTASPRTAVGQKADGTLIFYTIDGRQSGHSVGASLAQVARRLVELECVTAVCLDGGGSTTMSATMPDSRTAEVINRPSDGSERAVSNQVFLVAEPSRAGGQLSHFYVRPSHRYVLAGSKVEISAAAVNTSYCPMDSSYRLSASAGKLEGNVLTTPAEGGEITVTASSGGRSGSTTVYAIPQPQHVAVRNSSGALISELTVLPGSVTALTGSAAHNHISLKADPEAFTWAVEGNIGTIDQNGIFTAAAPGAGRIVISAGGVSAAIHVTVSGKALQTIEDFESGAGTFAGGIGMSAGIVNGDAVKLGKGALQMEYRDLQNGRVATNAYYEVPEEYSSVNLWIKGDGSQNVLRLLSGDGSSIIGTDICTLESTEWKQYSVTLPAISTIISGFEVEGLREEIEDPVTGKVIRNLLTPESGHVSIDHLVASFFETVDSGNPTVTAALDRENWAVTAVIDDEMDGVLPKESVTVSYNGSAVDFSYDETTGQAVVFLPGPGESHEAMRITVTAKDASGNLGRASVDVDAYNVGHKFTDTGSYWGAVYADFLYNAGITSGYGDGSFRPNQNINRAQFSVMLYRYLGLKDADYADVKLPFADAAQIPDYALPAARALYSLGIVNGSYGSDGRLYFNPASSLTRAQAAAMIGRTQPKGYAAADLMFADAEQIPGYALPYIRIMAAQGIINGYEDGTFRPSNNITRGQMAKILYNLM